MNTSLYLLVTDQYNEMMFPIYLFLPTQSVSVKCVFYTAQLSSGFTFCVAAWTGGGGA